MQEDILNLRNELAILWTQHHEQSKLAFDGYKDIEEGKRHSNICDGVFLCTQKLDEIITKHLGCRTATEIGAVPESSHQVQFAGEGCVVPH